MAGKNQNMRRRRRLASFAQGAISDGSRQTHKMDVFGIRIAGEFIAQSAPCCAGSGPRTHTYSDPLSSRKAAHCLRVSSAADPPSTTPKECSAEKKETLALRRASRSAASFCAWPRRRPRSSRLMKGSETPARSASSRWLHPRRVRAALTCRGNTGSRTSMVNSSSSSNLRTRRSK